MPYRFRLQEPLDDGLRRIAREQLGRAIAGFSPGKPRDAGIHDARRRLKKVRALLRLVRPALGEKSFRQFNWDLRDAGMLLSGARDLYVLDATLSELEAHAPARAKAALGAARRAITEAQTIAQNNTDAAAVDEGVERIRASLQSIASLVCADLDISHVTRGFKRSYAHCRKAFEAATESGSDEAFHEWRKATQRHWRQLLLLKAAWRDFFEVRASLAEQLSGLLGQDHDLAILKTFAAAHIGKGLTPKQSETIFALAQLRQDALRAEAKSLAATLLAASPKALARETKAYWQAAAAQEGDVAQAPHKTEHKKAKQKKAVENRADQSKDETGEDADDDVAASNLT